MSGWQVIYAEAERHVVPVGEQHSHTCLCWCMPTRDDAFICAADVVWVHHSRDRREYTVERQ